LIPARYASRKELCKRLLERSLQKLCSAVVAHAIERAHWGK
jgi:hypothetical protein